MNTYDTAYKKDSAYFGTEPEALVTAFMGRIRPGGRVLDIGVGQGRNALPLARAGFRVTGIDPSVEAVAAARRRAEAEGLSLDLQATPFQEYEPEAPFDAVLCFGLMPELSRAGCASLVHRLHAWTEPGSLLLLTAWHVDDPSYERVRDTWERVGLHSFRSPDGRYRTYLARGVVRNLLVGWKTLHHREFMGPPHRHGPDGEEHRHGVIELAAVRKVV